MRRRDFFPSVLGFIATACCLKTAESDGDTTTIYDDFEPQPTGQGWDVGSKAVYVGNEAGEDLWLILYKTPNDWWKGWLKTSSGTIWGYVDVDNTISQWGDGPLEAVKVRHDLFLGYFDRPDQRLWIADMTGFPNCRAMMRRHTVQ